jgi:hypothetical protein
LLAFDTVRPDQNYDSADTMTSLPDASAALQDLRRRNLKRITTMYGGPTRVATLLGLKSASYLSQLASGHRPIKEDRARSIEDTLKLERGWMDKEHAGAPVFGELDPANSNAKQAADTGTSSMMSQVVHAVGAILEEQQIVASPAKFAILLDIALEIVQHRGTLDRALMRKVVTLLK